MQRLRSPFVIAALIGATALLGLLVYGLGSTSPDRAIEDSLAKGEREAAPGFDLPRLDGGGRRTLADYRGKVVVLNVWGSWCAPCVAEAPDLQKTWAGIQADQVPAQFLGIDFREDPARGAAFSKKAGITYPSLSDESGVTILALQGKAPTVPTTPT